MITTKGSPDSLVELTQVGVFSVGKALPFIQERVTAVSSMDVKLTLNLGSVDHFLGIYITNLPSVYKLKVGFKLTVRTEDVYTIVGVEVNRQTIIKYN